APQRHGPHAIAKDLPMPQFGGKRAKGAGEVLVAAKGGGAVGHHEAMKGRPVLRRRRAQDQPGSLQSDGHAPPRSMAFAADIISFYQSQKGREAVACRRRMDFARQSPW